MHCSARPRPSPCDCDLSFIFMLTPTGLSLSVYITGVHCWGALQNNVQVRRSRLSVFLIIFPKPCGALEVGRGAGALLNYI